MRGTGGGFVDYSPAHVEDSRYQDDVVSPSWEADGIEPKMDERPPPPYEVVAFEEGFEPEGEPHVGKS